MKKFTRFVSLLTIAALLLPSAALARPHGPGPGGPRPGMHRPAGLRLAPGFHHSRPAPRPHHGFHHAPPPPRPHHRHHISSGDVWRTLGVAAGVGLISSAVYNATRPETTTTTTYYYGDGSSTQTTTTSPAPILVQPTPVPLPTPTLLHVNVGY